VLLYRTADHDLWSLKPQLQTIAKKSIYTYLWHHSSSILGGGVVNALDLNDFCLQSSNAFGRASSNLVLGETYPSLFGLGAPEDTYD
jgi:hypothetical protein